MNASEQARVLTEDEWEYRTTLMIDVVVRGRTPRGQSADLTDVKSIVTRHLGLDNKPLPAYQQCALLLAHVSPQDAGVLCYEVDEMLAQRWREDDLDAAADAFNEVDDE